MALQRPDTLTDAVAKHISDAIVRGEFSPGASLPEVALARSLNTSRGTVREALRKLAAGGLVEIIPHRGVFVTQLSVRATWEITSLRAILEPYAARLALEAAGGDPAYHHEVEAAFADLRRIVTAGDPIAVADADIAFHRAVFARCGHGMLLHQLDTLQVLTRRLVLMSELYASDGPSVIRQHEPIAAAVRARDPEALEAAVRSHVIEAGETLMTIVAATDAPRTRRKKAAAPALGGWPEAIAAPAGAPPALTPNG
jgi:DNA-binding GntR family transcriptional regulator